MRPTKNFRYQMNNNNRYKDGNTIAQQINPVLYNPVFYIFDNGPKLHAFKIILRSQINRTVIVVKSFFLLGPFCIKMLRR